MPPIQSEFKTAADLYLKLQPEQLQPIDYPILAKLAAYLAKQAGQAGYNPEDLANRLYEQGQKLQLQLPKSYQTNLYYNQARLNAKSNVEQALTLLVNARNIDPSNHDVQNYFKKCFASRAVNAPLCTSVNSEFPATLPVYACKDYPVLAIAKLGSGNPDNLCQ